MRGKNRTKSNGPANFLMVVGFALLVAGGVAAYPNLGGWLGLSVAPEGFGDEQALSASLIEVGEALPAGTPDSSALPGAGSAVATPAILPETPLQSEVTPTLVAHEQPRLPSPTMAAPTTTDFAPGVPTRLVIPSIKLDAPVVPVGWSIVNQNGQQVSVWDVPNRRAAGWLKTTAQVGQPGNTVLDGHHNIYGEVFRYLVDLKQGDTIQVWVDDQSREYVISLMKILPEKGQPLKVQLENARWIQPTKDERLTLVTCWPYESNTHRLIVVALPIEASSPATDAE